MFDSDVRARRARSTLPGRMLFAAFVVLAACANSFAAPLPPATNGVIAFSGLGHINPDGTGLTWFEPSYGFDPAWSTDGKKLAFAVDNFDNQPWCGCILVANADGSGITPISTPPDTNQDRYPAWSPDGSKILFTRTVQLYVMNSDGSNPVALPQYGIRPSWSPDGARIVYQWDGAVITANADGTNPTFVHEGYRPAWSRDGARIAFSAYDWDSLWLDLDIYTANPDGSDVRQVTSGFSDREVAWSPDGSQLAFHRVPDSDDHPAAEGLYVMKADGSGQTLLVDSIWAESPAWQPIPTAPPAFPFAGFFSPLGPAGTLNVAKAGSSVPVKFSLGGNRGLDILAAGSPSTQAIACTGTGAAPTTVTTSGSAGSSGLTYNALSDLYTYVMKTDKAWTNTCRRLTVTLTDGTSHTADFRFN